MPSSTGNLECVSQRLLHAQTVTDSRGLECFFIYLEAYYSAFACKHTVCSIETTFMDQ